MSEKAHPRSTLCRRRIKGAGYLIAHLPNGGERDKNADSLVCSNVALESCEETALLEVLDVHDHEHTLGAEIRRILDIIQDTKAHLRLLVARRQASIRSTGFLSCPFAA